MLKDLIKNYFLNGFSLANRSLNIFLVLLSLSLVGFIPSFLGKSIFANILQFVTLPVFFIHFGFLMSIPLFLTDKQKGKAVNYRNLLIVTFRNAKRLIIPGIIFLILFVILGFLLLFITAYNLAKTGGDPNQITAAHIQNFVQSLLKFNPIIFILSALFSFFVFTSIYFSLENKGFFGSVKRSILFGFRNLNYVVMVFLIYAINYSVSSLFPLTFEIPPSFQSNLGLLIRAVLGQYIIFIIITSSLLYYQSKTQNQ